MTPTIPVPPPLYAAIGATLTAAGLAPSRPWTRPIGVGADWTSGPRLYWRTDGAWPTIAVDHWADAPTDPAPILAIYRAVLLAAGYAVRQTCWPRSGVPLLLVRDPLAPWAEGEGTDG
jgi:hypothetical protein